MSLQFRGYSTCWEKIAESIQQNAQSILPFMRNIASSFVLNSDFRAGLKIRLVSFDPVNIAYDVYSPSETVHRTIAQLQHSLWLLLCYTSSCAISVGKDEYIPKRTAQSYYLENRMKVGFPSKIHSGTREAGFLHRMILVRDQRYLRIVLSMYRRSVFSIAQMCMSSEI